MSRTSRANTEVWSARSDVGNVRESRVRRALEVAGPGPGVLLDVACGSGLVGAEFARRGWTVHGLEMTPNLAAEAAGRLSGVVRADLAESFPFAAASFDLVFGGEIIEHLVDTDAFLAEIHRVLRPGGRVVLTTPNLASFENRVRLLLGRYPVWLEYRTGGEGHVRGYTPRVLRKQLAEHGFRVVAHTGNWVPFLPQRFVDDLRHPWVARTGPWAPSFAMDIIMAADKTGP